MKFNGVLYYRDEHRVLHPITAFVEEWAASKSELEQRLLAEEWDARLDSAGCEPVFQYQGEACAA